MVPLADLVLETQYGTAAKSNDVGRGRPVLRMNNLTYEGEVDLRDLKHVELTADEGGKLDLRPGDMLFNRTNSRELVGKTAVWDGPDGFTFAGYLVRVRLHNDRVLPQWVSAFMNSPEGKTMLLHMAKPSINMANISASDLMRLRVPVAPVEHQRRTIALLRHADAVRRKRKEAIALTEKLLRSAFLEMFGDPVTNPKGWPKKPLSALGRVVTGGTPPSDGDRMFGGSIPFVTPGDLESNEPARRMVTDAGAAKSRTVRAGSALVCCIGATIGKIAKASQRSAFNQQINAVEWKDAIDDEFGLLALRFFKPVIVSSASSTTLPILKKSSFEKLEIPVPPRGLQKEFAKRVGGCDRLESSAKEFLEVSQELLECLVQRAFRGEPGHA